MRWVEGQVVAHGLAAVRTLEIGSHNVNGSVRDFFHGEYVGIDIHGGPGVDIPMSSHDLSEHDFVKPFECIVCTEMLEHDTLPWWTLTCARRVTVPGGVLLLTCRGFDSRGSFPLHEYPRDVYRFTVVGIEAMLHATGWHPHVVLADPEAPGVFAVGIATS